MCRALLEICCSCFGFDDSEPASSEETYPLIGEYNKSDVEVDNVDDEVVDRVYWSSEKPTESASDVDEETVNSLECSTSSLSSLDREVDSPDGFLVLDLSDLDRMD